MVDIAITAFVVVVLVLATAARSLACPRPIRPWLWVALAEYLACAVAQYFFGAELDANTYRRLGTELAKFLDASFGWAAGEILSLLLQQPSAFDTVVVGAGSNTGSMAAASAWLVFVVRGSPYAVQALVAGLAMLGALSIYQAFQDACPQVPPLRLFSATVLFPSIAFWTSSLHKESFCLMGIGLALAAWRAALKLRLRALVYAPLGAVLIVMFRAPAMPPLLFGLALHFVMSRLQRARGPEVTVIGPLYISLGLAAVALSMVLLARLSPSLALERLGETVAVQQGSWSTVEGGSSFDIDGPAAQSLSAQLLRAPLGLVNALLRPQLFDVRNPLVLVSAVEMTAITWLLVRVLRLHGLRGLVLRIQRSPFLAMCTVVTIVGCTFVGLTTKNFGSMARYRVPFLPFYAAWLAILTQRTAARHQTKPAPRRKDPRTPPARRAAAA